MNPSTSAREFTIDDLPSFSRWPARLLGLEPLIQRQKSAAEVTREYEKEKWGALLSRVNSDSGPVDLDTAEGWAIEEIPDTLCSIGRHFELLSAVEARRRYLAVIESVLSRYLPAPALVELGAGYGSVILQLARKQAFSGLSLFAGEFTASGIELIRRFALAASIRITVGNCDLASKWIVDFPVPEGALIFTSMAAHYIPHLTSDYVSGIAAFSPRVVVNIEPCYEHCDLATLTGALRRRYIEVNDYNRNLVSLLHAEQAAGRLRILEEERAVVGINPLLPVSVIAWSPCTNAHPHPMSAENPDRTFLAVTALEEFWDTRFPMLYLGLWCRLFSRRGHWGKLGGKILENPWASTDARHNAARICNSVYEQLLGNLGEALNALHSRQHSNRYWRILFGPWLHHYITMMYDLLTRVDQALESHPALTSLGLSDESFVVPADTAEFIFLMKEDSYCLQLCTRVMRFAGIPMETKPYVVGDEVTRQRANTARLSVFLKWVSNLLLRMSSSREAVLLKSSYFPHSTELKLFLQTGLSARRMSAPKVLVPRVPVQLEMRHLLRSRIGESTRFEQLLRETIPLDMPQSLLESYAVLGDQTRRIYREYPKAIFTANGLYEDEAFQRFAAGAADQGTLLLGTPHGTRYGVPAWMFAEEHETSICDRYYSWGWERSNCHARVIPMPAGKLIGREEIGADNMREGILWATTAAPRWLREFPFTPEMFSGYLDWQQIFLGSLDTLVKPHVRLRPHREDQGWDIVMRLQRSFPDLAVETWAVPFAERLRKCRLYVCDHCSTTFGESLAADQPTVLFWKDEAHELRPEAQPVFDLLRRAGILYHDPLEAAACVNRIYGDVEAWWNDPERQYARRQFCNSFARTAPDAIKLWSREFRDVLTASAADDVRPQAGQVR
jgi:putative transferase (TIGR04331 family)